MSLYRKVQGTLVNVASEQVQYGPNDKIKNYRILAFVVHSWYHIATWPAESADQALKEFKKANPKAENQYGGLKVDENGG